MAQRLNAKPEALAARGEQPPDVDGDPLTRFSRELAHRYPKVMIQRFIMPSNVRECREVFMREITSADEVEAAIYADQTASAIEKASVRLMNDAETRESVRLAIVGFGDGPAPARGKPGVPVVNTDVLYRHVNHDGVPLEEINGWRVGAWACLRSFFGQINGVPADEIRSGIEGAQTVGAFAPPTSASQPVQDAGK